MADDKSTLISRSLFLLKLIELSLAIICIGLIVDPINNKLQTNWHHVALVYASYAGFIIINTAAVLGQIKSDRMPKYMWVLFSFAGGSLFLASGSVIIDDWRHLWDRTKHLDYSKQYMDMMIASGIIAIFNAFVYFVDFVFSVVYG